MRPDKGVPTLTSSPKPAPSNRTLADVDIEFTVGRATEPVLQDWRWNVAKVVERLTGVRFDGVPPA